MAASAFDRRLAASALPPAVKAALACAGPGLRAAARKDPAFLSKLSAFLSDAGEALGLGAGEALFHSGFLPGDATPGRPEAALAELRAALFLRSEGFTKLKALERAAGKTADLRGELGGGQYFFEVRLVRGGLGAAAVKRLAAKFCRKAPQVKTSLKKGGGAGGGLIFVAEPLEFGALQSSAELLAVAAGVHSACGGGLRVCLVAGGSCAVYPPW